MTLFNPAERRRLERKRAKALKEQAEALDKILERMPKIDAQLGALHTVGQKMHAAIVAVSGVVELQDERIEHLVVEVDELKKRLAWKGV